MRVCNLNVRSEYDFKVIGRNLKKLRLAKDMTVEEVREYMQLGTVQSIYKWERGDGLPQADSLIALMHLYGVSNIEMITEEGVELSSSFFVGCGWSDISGRVRIFANSIFSGSTRLQRARFPQIFRRKLALRPYFLLLRAIQRLNIQAKC